MLASAAAKARRKAAEAKEALSERAEAFSEKASATEQDLLQRAKERLDARAASASTEGRAGGGGVQLLPDLPEPEPEPAASADPETGEKETVGTLSALGARARRRAAGALRDAEEAARARVAATLATREAEAAMPPPEVRFAHMAMHGWMEKEGGVFSSWQPLFFVVDAEAAQLLTYERAEVATPSLRLATAGLVVRLAQASTRTHVLRLDTEDETVEKLILDAGSAEALDRWVLALGNTGAIVPAEYLGRLDERALELLSATQTPRRRRIKKGWLEMKTTLTTRATSGSLAEWQAHWFELELPMLTMCKRPGGPPIFECRIEELELVVGPSVEEELGRDYSFRTMAREPWDTAPEPHWEAKDVAARLPWIGLQAASQLDCDSWVQALSTRRVRLVRTQAEHFGLEIGAETEVSALVCEPDGIAGPAELAHVRKLQRIIRVDGEPVSTREEVLELLHDAAGPGQPAGGGKRLKAEVELTLDGLGLPPIREDESDEDYSQRLRAEDEARMRRELIDDEGLARKAEQELAASRAAQAAEEKERQMEASRRRVEEAEEQHQYLQRVSVLLKRLTGGGQQTERVRAALNATATHGRCLLREGLLSKSNEEQKRLKLEAGVGHSYFFLFSDMLLFVRRAGKRGQGAYKVEELVEWERLREVRLTSHAYDADAAERRGITIAPLHLDRSSITPREFPYRVYARSIADQAAWVAAFQRVLLRAHEETSRGAPDDTYGAHHARCAGTIFDAAVRGDLLLVERALLLDPTVAAAQDDYGSTALMLASRHGCVDVVMSLVSRGLTSIDAVDDHGRTAAHLAAEGGHTSVLEVLGDHSANFNRGDLDDRVALGILLARGGGGSLEAAKLVAQRGGVVDRVDRGGRSGLHKAVAAAKTTELEQWLELGANVDKPMVDSSRATPLMVAAMWIADPTECATVVRALLGAGANPNKPGNRSGATILQTLVDGGKIDAAAACVRGGATLHRVKGLTDEQTADFKALASQFTSERRKATVKRFAKGAAAAVAGFVEEREVEPTLVRRNYLLTLRKGNVEEALAMVTFRGLLTDHLPNLTASAVPFVGVAYGVIQPIWMQMRDVCLVAALYGHDIEDEDVKARILECVTGDLAERAAAGSDVPVSMRVKDAVVKKSIHKLSTKITTELAARQASALAISSGPVAPVLNYIYRSAVDKELGEIHTRAREVFAAEAPGVPPEAYLVEIPTTSRWHTMGRSIDRAEQTARATGARVGGAIDDKLGASAKAEKASLVVQSAASAAASKIDSVLGIRARVNRGLEAATQKKEELVGRAQVAGVQRLTGYVDRAIDRIATSMVARLNNSLDLPAFMQRAISKLIRDVAADLAADSQLGVEDMLGLLDEDEDDRVAHAEAASGGDLGVERLSCYQRVRAFVLHTWCPYDHRIGHQLSDPAWWFLKVLGMLPWGISFVFNAVMFYMIDKRDQYQAVKVILDFKGLQALSAGVGSLLAGAFLYVRCANAEPVQTCSENGPGVTMFYPLSWCGWVGGVLLSYLAFGMLQYRTRNATPVSDDGESDEYNMRSRLEFLMIYDFIAFGSCMAIAAIAAMVGAQFWLYAYWCRCLYGVLALPWVPTVIPMVDELLAHARATGYTVRGKCRVKKMAKPEDDSSSAERDVRAQATMFSRAAQSDTVLAEILDDMLNVAIRGGSLPIHEWSNSLAPIFKSSADAISLRKHRLATAAKKRGGGVSGWKEGAKEVALNETASQAKVLLASNAHDLARKAAIMINAALEMPKVLGEAIEDIIVSFVPDVTEELNEGIDTWLISRETDGAPGSPGAEGAAQVDQQDVLQRPAEVESRCCGALMYHWMPFDTKSDPVRCGRCLNMANTLRFVGVNSLLGTNYLMMMGVWALLEKSDEYQLVHFILYFKGHQAISTGLLYTAVGVLTYMTCVDEHANMAGKKLTECQDSILAHWPLFWPLIAGWVISLLLIWAAFGKLLRAHRAKIHADDDAADDDVLQQQQQQHETAEAQRERLLRRARSVSLLARTRFWLLWDIGALCVCGVVACVCLLLDDSSDGDGLLELHRTDWELRQVVFWCKVLHSVLCLPFVMFTLPLFYLCFSQAPATGYTRAGQCVRLQKKMDDGNASRPAEVDSLDLLDQEEEEAVELDLAATPQSVTVGAFPDIPDYDVPQPEPAPNNDASMCVYAASSLPSVPAASPRESRP